MKIILTADATPGQPRQFVMVWAKLSRFWHTITAACVLLIPVVSFDALLVLLLFLTYWYNISCATLEEGLILLRNFRCAIRFWMRLLSSGSVTSVQLSFLAFALDLDFDECDFELESWVY